MADHSISGINATVDITQDSPEQYPLEEDRMVFSLSDSLSDDTITLSSGYDTGYTLGSNVSITGIGVPWTTTSDSITIDSNWHNRTSAKIQLDGPDADIEINGESLRDMLGNIEQRLNILKPNPELESEWEELRALGDAYRKLEADIEAKMKTWEKLSKVQNID